MRWIGRRTVEGKIEETAASTALAEDRPQGAAGRRDLDRRAQAIRITAPGKDGVGAALNRRGMGINRAHGSGRRTIRQIRGIAGNEWLNIAVSPRAGRACSSPPV